MSNDNSSNSYSNAKVAQNFFRDTIQSCFDNNTSKFEELVADYLAKNNQLSMSDVMEDFKSEGRNLLHIATSSGAGGIVKFILKDCQSLEFINAQDDRGFTPLLNATISENNEIMSELIALSANVNTQNKEGAAAIHFAAGDGSIPRMNLLLEAGADLTPVSQSGTVLHWAAGKGHAEAVTFLVSRGADVNANGKDGMPAVLLAAATSSDTCVKSLVEAGADVGHIVSGNLTVLHICAENLLHSAVQAIINTETGRKCSLIATDDGNLPIHLAAMAGSRKLVELLLPVSQVDGSLVLSVDEYLADGHERMKAWEAKEEAKTAATAGSTSNGSTTAEGAQPVQEPAEAVDTQAIIESDRYKLLGNDYFKSAKYQLAIDAYSTAITLNGRSHALWSNRSACFMATGDHHSALRDGDMCRHLKPDWAKGFYRVAVARLALGLFEEAAVAAFEGCKLDEANTDLKALLKKAVQMGREDHQRKQAAKA